MKIIVPILVLAGAAHAAVSADSLPATTSTSSIFRALDEVALPPHLALESVPRAQRVTRDEAVAIALRDSPVIKAARDAVEMARGDYVHSSAANNPTVQAGGSYLPHPRDSDGPNAQDFPDRDVTYFQYVLPTSGRRYWATHSAQGRFEAAVAVESQAELDLVLAVKSAYADLQQATETIAVNAETWKIAHVFAELAARQFKAGAVPYANVVAAGVAEAQAEQALTTAHFDLRTKEKALAFQLGHPTEKRVAAADALDEAPVHGTLDELQRAALAHRPEVVAAEATLRGLVAQIGAAKADRRPDLTLQGTPSDITSNSGGVPYKAYIQMPLWDRGQIGGNVAQARAAAQQAEHNLQQEKLQVGQDVAAAYLAVMTQEGVLTQEVERILPATRRLLEMTRQTYLAGASTILDVLYAQQQYRTESLNHVAAAGALARADAQLERATASAVPRERRHPFRWRPDDEAER